MPKLTKRAVEALPIETKDYFVWDSQIAGFGVRVMPSGAKTYQAQYRKGGRTRRMSIGRHGKITVDEARKLAKEIMGEVAKGEKRAEVIQQNKMGWLTIWNAALAAVGKPPLNLTDRTTSQVWRFEMRLGSKQLRNRFEMRNWQDVNDIIGDAFTDALGRIRYCMPTTDSNRARWPTHELWRQFDAVVGTDLLQNCAGVMPCDVVKANRAAKMRELDAQLAGLFITRAAISDVSADSFGEFLESHLDVLVRLTEENSTPLPERLAKARGKYRLS